MSLRQKLYQVLEHPENARSLNGLNTFLWVLIILNVFAIIMESEPSIGEQYQPFFFVFEVFSIICFTLEYLTRVWVSIEPSDDKHPIRSRLRYMLTPLAIIDLIAIIPFYLGFFFGFNDLRILRSLRLLRILKVTRYSRSLELLMSVLRQETENLLSVLSMLLVLMVLAAAGIYVVESEVQPEVFGSIPKALWWALVTLTTVGYGDAVPITLWGRLFSAVITISGIAVAALPAGILASGIMNELDRRRNKFRNLVLKAYEDHHIDLKEQNLLDKHREVIGLSRSDARLVIDEVIRETRLLTQHSCPYCGHQLAIRHPAGVVKIEKQDE